MKKLLLTIAIVFFGLGAYNVARAAECSVPFATIQEQAAEIDGAKFLTITPSQIAALNEAAGPPPKTDLDRPYEMYLVIVGEMAKLFVVQDGCITISTGTAPTELFLKKMGVIDVNG